MARKDKHAFWQALVFSLFVFVIGFFLGILLENSRSIEIRDLVLNSELNLLDEQLRGIVLEDFNVECEIAKKSTFVFADEIFEEARKLELYDGSSTFSDGLLLLHKRYDLLRVLLWNEAIDIRERCGEDFHIVVYFFEYGTKDINIMSKQNVFEKVLIEVKNNHPEEILLIPIAGNLDLNSVDLILNELKISEIPTIVIDEKVVIYDLLSVRDLEERIFEDNN
jgi:hypothetical protein